MISHYQAAGFDFMAKREDEELARRLRKRGCSYSEIRRDIPVAKSTISRWCKDIELSRSQKDRLGKKYDVSLKGAKAVQAKRKVEVDVILNKAKNDMGSLSINDLKLVGAMLYWAEGNKTISAGITNSDPSLIKIMIRWFREICSVPDDKFKAHLHIHSGQNEMKMKRYWVKMTKIPIEQFGKSHIKKEGSGYRKNILYNGTIKINIFDKNLLYKILGWIEGVKFQLMGG